MLVFAGLTPNSPLLLPNINPDRINEVAETRQALEELSEELYAAHPDILLLFAESKTMYPEAFSLNVADPYVGDLTEFGDLGYHKTYHPDFGFTDRLQRHLRQTELPISLSTDDRLNFATTVPLELLTGHLPDIRIVPVAPCQLDAKMHFNAGAALKHLVLESDKRIAVIATGDMSHALSKDAPAGFHKDGLAYDETMLAILREKNTAGLLQLPEALIKNAHDSSYHQICMLFGALDGLNPTSNILSYEAPFGVGFCVANFVL